MNRRRKAPASRTAVDAAPEQAKELRIIGGHHRGRKLRYHGDPLVRPMKHRVREAIFNLISGESEDRHAIDLFAGTGALGLEAISRGAASATFIEQHVPTSRVLGENIAELDAQDSCDLLVTSAFLWGRRDLASEESRPPADRPWLVFCSPPYKFWVERQLDMFDLIGRLMENAPATSVIVAESDERFDFALLDGDWNVREYPPAVVGIWRKG
jgi:16S rRNA (guanine966-N2)-methyltransferase